MVVHFTDELRSRSDAIREVNQPASRYGEIGAALRQFFSRPPWITDRQHNAGATNPDLASRMRAEFLR